MEVAKKKSPVLKILIAIVVVAVLGLYFYVDNISIYYPMDGMYYYVDGDEELESMMVIVEDGKFSLVLSSPINASGYYRMNYSYSQTNWKRFIGDWFFSGNSFLSLKKAEFEGQPITVRLKFTDGSATNLFFTEVTELTDDDVQSPVTETLYFTDNGVYFMGEFFDEVTTMPEEMDGICLFLK